MNPTPLQQLFLISLATSAVIMLVLWAFQVRSRNATSADAGWAACIVVNTLIFAALAGGAETRRLCLTAMACLWGGRLIRLVLGRLRGPEDARYARLRSEWGASAGPMFLGLYFLQAAVAAAVSVPYLIAAADPAPELRPLETAALLVWCAAFAGEAIADAQLRAFKNSAAGKGRVCDAGLWRYSRHPNYFFEWVMWVALALFAHGSPHGHLAWGAPLIMLVFLTQVSGIPPAEEQSLRSKGDAYRRYQQATSSFVPWPPRRSPR
ncbi:MAG: hypothetical protein MOGMAGMI_01712 [Candidatus Omnitrophica bacterium]|nr:hypothetical protein [Candidatus Omnitrophota bacterium]